MPKAKESQFKDELKLLGVDDNILEEIMEIHRQKPDLAPYDCKRQYNIKKNEEKLRALNLFSSKPQMKVIKPAQPVKRKWTHKPAAPLEPSRKSARLAGITPLKYNPDLEEFKKAVAIKRTPKPAVKLSFDDIVDIKSDNAEPIFSALKDSRHCKMASTTKRDTSSILQQISRFHINPDKHITKLCKNRISSIALHPGNKLIVAGGSKTGEVGLFMPGQKKVVIRLAPHSDIVGGIQFSKEKLFTASYDGGIRMFDPETLQFDQVFSWSDGWLRQINVLDKNIVMAASANGQALKIDVRENKQICAYPSKENVKEYGSLWGLDHNKFDMNYFLTTSNNAKISAWDHRNTKHPVDVDRTHEKTVSSAVFDPIKGEKIVSIAYDDQVSILEFSSKSKITKLMKFFHANNTGRFLTKFQARWHPASDELFVMGSMAHPRRVEIYNVQKQVEMKLSNENIGSIQSLVQFHDSGKALVCGNGSGYCYIFHERECN